MKKKTLKIGNSQAFWGDSPHASVSLLEQAADLDFLTLDYLAEVSLSIMAIQKEKNPDLGYAKDFIELISNLIPFWQKGSPCKIVSNAGGLNPMACALACKELLEKAGLGMTVGVCYGDDVLPLILKDHTNPEFNNLDTQEPIAPILDQLVSANAYLGAKGIVDALRAGANIVITGRVADPSLTVGPCIYHFDWSFTDYDCLAAATIAGHLIECGTQSTGGISTDWLLVPDTHNIGFPIVEMSEDGSFILTKPENSGGVVNEQTVKEQLLYEISDPGAYLSPDATVSFLQLELKEEAKNRMLIKGAKGFAPPKTLKVSASYKDGFSASAMLTIFGPSAIKKARRSGEIILEHVKSQGFTLDKSYIECLGANAVIPGVFEEPKNALECVLRVAVADHRYEAVKCFTREVAPLVTSGPQGVTGYLSGRAPIREVFGFWPCLIDAIQVTPLFEVLK